MPRKPQPMIVGSALELHSLILSGRLWAVCVPPHVGTSMANQGWWGASAPGRGALYCGGGHRGGSEELSEDHPKFACCGMYKPEQFIWMSQEHDTLKLSTGKGGLEGTCVLLAQESSGAAFLLMSNRQQSAAQRCALTLASNGLCPGIWAHCLSKWCWDCLEVAVSWVFLVRALDVMLLNAELLKKLLFDSFQLTSGGCSQQSVFLPQRS